MEHIRIYKEKDYQAVSRRAANLISAQVIGKPNSVLGLATGTSPIGTYKQLVEWYEKGDLDFSNTISINLDEYVGLPPDNEQSYHHFMHEHLFSKINIPPENTHVPNGYSQDLNKACSLYDSYLHSVGGIDLQILGIGNNGHIGFNEPNDHFILDTHVVNLSENTIAANARLFNNINEVPRQAITMGIRYILQANKVVLIATGEAKADALYHSFMEAVTPKFPASILQFHHDLTIIADEAALAKLPDKLYTTVK